MSRTRKDTPRWVTLNDSRLHRGEDHSWWQHHRGECDIDRLARAGGRGLPRCSHTLAWPYEDRRYRDHNGDDVRNEWSKPERNHTRTVLGRARVRWNTAGTIDEDTVPVRQHQRSPWKGGYWD